MATKKQPENNREMQETSDAELVITRTFNAPRELVYKALSEPEALAQWWGPKGSKIQVSKFDFRPDGMFHYCMQSPMGEMWGMFRYLEISDRNRIVFISSFSDKDGNITPNPFLPKFPLEIMNIVTLTEHEGATILTLRGGPVNATEEQNKAFNDMKSGMQQGFGGTFDQLDEYLAKTGR